MRAAVPLILLSALGACAAPGGPYPSLQPRPGEAIDPRIQPVAPVNDRPVAAALAAQLAQLVAEARSGDADFAPAITRAEQLAAAAGAAQSESWIAAQEALSVAIAARRPTVSALAEVDALTANALRSNGGIAPRDFSAIQQAAAEISRIDSAQAERISGVQRRLGQ